jgi:hypothetical protein
MNKRQRESQYFRTHELYCLRQMEHGRYIKLNRDYKPLGLETQEWVRYENFPLELLPGLTPQVATKLSARGSDDVTQICLYNDGCVPTSSDANMRAYLARLALLATLEIASDPAPGRRTAIEIRNTCSSPGALALARSKTI